MHTFRFETPPQNLGLWGYSFFKELRSFGSAFFDPQYAF